MHPLAADSSVIKEIFEALSPTGQLVFGALIIGLGAFFIVRGWLEGRKPQEAAANGLGNIPTWIMVGPMHDMMQSVHGMADRSRQQTAILRENQTILAEHAKKQTDIHLANQAILRDIAKELSDWNHGQEYGHKLLEQISRNQELGIHPALQNPTASRPERPRRG
jgi:hypothetical protein